MAPGYINIRGSSHVFAISNEIAKVRVAINMVEQKHLRWYGYIRRLEPHRIPTRVFCSKMDNISSRQKPKKRWIEVVREAAERRGFSFRKTLNRFDRQDIPNNFVHTSEVDLAWNQKYDKNDKHLTNVTMWVFVSLFIFHHLF